MEARRPELFSATDIRTHSDKYVTRRTYKGQECEKPKIKKPLLKTRRYFKSEFMKCCMGVFHD